MIATASPAANDSDTPARTGTSPCGEGYDFATSLTISTSTGPGAGARSSGLVDLEHPVRRARDAVVAPDALVPAVGEARTLVGRFPQPIQTSRQALRFVWFDEKATRRLLDHLRERAMPRLHDRN